MEIHRNIKIKTWNFACVPQQVASLPRMGLYPEFVFLNLLGQLIVTFYFKYFSIN